MKIDESGDLYQFFAGWFHQDWQDDDDSVDDVISSFLSSGGLTRDRLVLLADAIDAFASSFTDDAALEHALGSELGCYYLPSADGSSARAWLHHVSGRLRESAGASS